MNSIVFYNLLITFLSIWALRGMLITISLKYKLRWLNGLLCLKCMGLWIGGLVMGLLFRDPIIGFQSGLIISFLGMIIENKLE